MLPHIKSLDFSFVTSASSVVYSVVYFTHNDVGNIAKSFFGSVVFLFVLSSFVLSFRFFFSFSFFITCLCFRLFVCFCHSVIFNQFLFFSLAVYLSVPPQCHTFKLLKCPISTMCYVWGLHYHLQLWMERLYTPSSPFTSYRYINLLYMTSFERWRLQSLPYPYLQCVETSTQRPRVAMACACFLSSVVLRVIHPDHLIRLLSK